MLPKLRLTLLMSCVTAIALTSGASANAAETRYLNWNNKAAAPTSPSESRNTPATTSPFLTPPQPMATPTEPAVSVESGYYGIPASPYGRVGAMGPHSAMPAPRQTPPAASIPYAAPEPYIAPAATPSRSSAPQSAPVAYESAHGRAAPTQTEAYSETYAAPPQQMAAYMPPAQTVRSPMPAPTPMPESAPVEQVPSRPPSAVMTPAEDPDLHVTGGYTESGYQVPASSPYASRIASARANQRQANPEAQASAPAMSVPLADEATAAYIPSEAMTAAAEASEPRYYSLHRQYGLEPDRIPPPQPSQGALLVPSTLMEDGLSGDDDRDQEHADNRSRSHK